MCPPGMLLTAQKCSLAHRMFHQLAIARIPAPHCTAPGRGAQCCCAIPSLATKPWDCSSPSCSAAIPQDSGPQAQAVPLPLNGIQCYFLRPSPARLHLSDLQCCTGPGLGPTSTGWSPQPLPGCLSKLRGTSCCLVFPCDKM